MKSQTDFFNVQIWRQTDPGGGHWVLKTGRIKSLDLANREAERLAETMPFVRIVRHTSVVERELG